MFIGPTFGHCSIFNKLLSKPKWQAYVGPTLVQRYAPHAIRTYSVMLNNSQIYIFQRWVNVVFSTNFYPKPKWQAYVGPMLAQRNAPNATRSCYNKSPVYIGPTLGQRSIFNKLLSKTKVAGIRWSNVGPT